MTDRAEMAIKLSSAIAFAREEIRKLEQRVKDRKQRLATLECQLDEVLAKS